jgi:serine/threonine protein kinase
MKATPEETIAHYRIIEPIGAGGMGAVFKAWDKKLHRVVAIKLLPTEYLSQQDRRRRFFQEARAASALNHPHILTVYEVGEDDGKPYIAMEYVEGDTLRHKIENRALKIKDTLDIAIQISEGLAKAHDLGIIHRDLKPENLMISRDGYAKILDFGLAKLVAQRERVLAADSEQKTLLRVKTESGTLLGTVNYMSPEQLLGQRVDRRCDIFSFGVVLCEMLTGTCPFVNENRIDTMHAILHRPPRLPEADNGNIPSGILSILTKALAKAPKDRYQSVSDLASELRKLKRDLELGKTQTVVGSRLVLKTGSGHSNAWHRLPG